MQTLMFAAFSLISVPAYVAMFGSKGTLEKIEAEESEEETCARFEKHLEEMTASAPQRCEPASGLFPAVRPRRFV
jgi:hypothetical protein